MKSLPQRKSPRLKDYDYSSSGGYFVTISTQQKQHFFGEITDGTMHLSDVGKIAHDHWAKTPAFYPSVQLSDYVVMPNHVHMILFLRSPANDKPKLGTVIGTYKAAVTRIARRQLDFTSVIWQTLYHDHIIRNEADLNRIREYVQNNPARWSEDTFNS